MSHIKCISYLNSVKGNYSLVLEDDITLDNTCLLNDDLKTIIKKCPPFDILQIQKIYHKPLSQIYTDWNIELQNGHIAGTAAYIISRQGITKIMKLISYNFDESRFLIQTKNISVTDLFLYQNVVTYTYKYNVISSLEVESYIHNEHVDWHKTTNKIQLKTIIENLVI